MLIEADRRSIAARYGVAILAVLAATAIRLGTLQSLENRFIYITFFPAIVVAAVIGGLGPGLLALVLSASVAWMWIGPGEVPWRLSGPDCLGAAVFLVNGVLIVAVCEALHRAREREKKARAERRMADAASHESENRFRLFADAAPVMIWMSDTTKACIWFNRAWLDFVGRTMEQEVGDRWTQNVHPDDVQHCLKTYSESFDAREPFTMDYRVRNKDGEYRWVLDNGTPLFRQDRQFLGYIGSCIDITAMKNAEQALRENEERLRLGLAAGATGTWDWEIETNRVTWSDKVYEFHGLTRESFDGTVGGFIKVIHPDDAERVQEAIRKALEQREDYTIEFRTVRPDGEIRWIATTGHVFFDHRGKPRRMLGATIDTTQRKAAEQEREDLLARESAARTVAEHASQMKDAFLAILSHELRTPLSAILGWVNVLNSGPRGEAELSEGLTIIERNARMQTQLIEDLLDMSRIVSGKIRLEMQRVEIEAVVDAALAAVRHPAQAKEIRLRKSLDPSLTWLKGDPARLQQVVWNLVSNAIKFTPRGGVVDVTLARCGSHASLRITDTGCGISPTFLPHIFERFRQADSSTTRKHSGLGIGLSIVKHLVELHGGTITATSPGEGRGATFEVLLPAPEREGVEPQGAPRLAPVTSQLPPDAGASGDGPRPATLKGARVLVIDDEPDSRSLVKRILEDRGAAITTAASVREGLDVLRSGPIDLVITDIGMPDEDGYSLVKRLRESAGCTSRAMPAIALTAFARPDDRDRAMTAGFDVFLTKPVEPADLVAAASRLASKSP